MCNGSFIVVAGSNIFTGYASGGRTKKNKKNHITLYKNPKNDLWHRSRQDIYKVNSDFIPAKIHF